MFRTLIAFVAGLVLLSSAPAFGQARQSQLQLQHTFTLRYWGTGLQFSDAGVIAKDSGSAWSFSYRGDVARSPWSVTFNYDTINVTPATWTWNNASIWNINGHYRLGVSGNSSYGVFAGIGSVSVSSSTASTSGSGTGLRLGAEFSTQLQGGWNVRADASFGPSWSSNFPGFPGMARGTTFDYSILVGTEFQPGLGIELGWKGLTWTVPAGPGCGTQCRWQFSGVTLGFVHRR